MCHKDEFTTARSCLPLTSGYKNLLRPV